MGAAPELEKSDIELDHELFFPVVNQLGHENETVRNLLIDAEHKISELDNIKRSLGKLVDPVSKTLRAFEETKSEKLSLQSTLNNTRVAYAKLREDLTNTEKRAATLEAEATRLREIATVAQQSVAALEQTKADQSSELNTRRTQIADLQRRVQQQGSDLQTTRDENRRMIERAAQADKRAVQLQGEMEAARQQAMLGEKERLSVQASLDKSLNDFAQTSRRLVETEKVLAATQSRLKTVEASLAEAQAERVRLSATLDEANHKHQDEMQLHTTRFEALHARSTLTDKLLDEARQTLIARADEIRAFDQRIAEAHEAHITVAERLAQVEAELSDRDLRIRDLEQSQVALTEQNDTLQRGIAMREGAYSRVQEKLQAESDLVQLLENQLKGARESSELQIEELNAQLQRERLERTMAEGALEAGRKDIARLLRELAALQYRPTAALQAAAAQVGQQPAAPTPPTGTRLQNAA